VRKVSFTGSTEVGKLLMRQSADTVKKVSLELRGRRTFISCLTTPIWMRPWKAPVISKYRNAGQTCVCANRIFAQDGIYEAFLGKIYRCGDEAKSRPGHRTRREHRSARRYEALWKKVQRLVGNATQKGARVVTGGRAMQGTFFQATILADVTTSMDIIREEIFGPVAASNPFTERKEVIVSRGQRYALRFGRVLLWSGQSGPIHARQRPWNMAWWASIPA